MQLVRDATSVCLCLWFYRAYKCYVPMRQVSRFIEISVNAGAIVAFSTTEFKGEGKPCHKAREITIMRRASIEPLAGVETKPMVS